jgi:glutamate racemase
VLGREVVLVSSAEETAFELRALLGSGEGIGPRSSAGGPGVHRFVSSGDVDVFRRLGALLLGPELADVELAAWD